MLRAMGKRQRSKWSVDRRQLVTSVIAATFVLVLGKVDKLIDRAWPMVVDYLTSGAPTAAIQPQPPSSTHVAGASQVNAFIVTATATKTHVNAIRTP